MAERVGVCRVSAEYDSEAVDLDRVPVVTTVHIATHPSAPVVNLEGGNSCRSSPSHFTPTQFLNLVVAPRPKQVRCSESSDNFGPFALQFPQARQVEMIHVCVGK